MFRGLQLGDVTRGTLNNHSSYIYLFLYNEYLQYSIYDILYFPYLCRATKCCAAKWNNRYKRERDIHPIYLPPKFYVTPASLGATEATIMKLDSFIYHNSHSTSFTFTLQPPTPLFVFRPATPPLRYIIPQSVKDVEYPPGLDAPIHNRGEKTPPHPTMYFRHQRQQETPLVPT